MIDQRVGEVGPNTGVGSPKLPQNKSDKAEFWATTTRTTSRGLGGSGNPTSAPPQQKSRWHRLPSESELWETESGKFRATRTWAKSRLPKQRSNTSSAILGRGSPGSPNVTFRDAV